MMPALLPPRRLTPEERAGFRMALACLGTWGNQIAATSIRLGGPAIGGPPPAERERMGRQIAAMAEALDRTIGRTG
jgi:hypothetical protein